VAIQKRVKQYRDPIITKLIELFEAHGPEELKGKYYYGQLYALPQNQGVLPAVFISQVRDQGSSEGTGRDRSAKSYQITVSVEMKKEWNRSVQAVETHMDLQRYLAGMDENYDWLPDSFMYQLRANETLDGEKKLYIDLGSITDAQILPGIEARGVGIYTYEGVIQFQVRHNQLRPSLA